jgi:hypothetical protein
MPQTGGGDPFMPQTGFAGSGQPMTNDSPPWASPMPQTPGNPGTGGLDPLLPPGTGGLDPGYKQPSPFGGTMNPVGAPDQRFDYGYNPGDRGFGQFRGFNRY